MTKYFELVVSDSNTRPSPKSIAEWLMREIVSLPPTPLEIGQQHDEELEIDRCELRPSGEGEPSFFDLLVYGRTLRVGPKSTIGDSESRLVLGASRLSEVVISVEFRETGAGSVHLVGECADPLADFVQFKIERIIQQWPATRELTPEGVNREDALTWDKPSQSPGAGTDDRPRNTQQDKWDTLPGIVTFNAKGDPIPPSKKEPKDNLFKYCVICQAMQIQYSDVYKNSPYATVESLRSAISRWKKENGVPRDTRGRKAVNKRE